MISARTENETDSLLRSAVATQIDCEPEITSRDLAVSARDGVVTLTGFVRHYYEKRAAERAAKAVYGVKAIANDIEVRRIGTRTGPEIARDIVQVMALDLTIPENRIKVSVNNGFVTLEGDVDWNYQRTRAESCVHRTAGVRGVNNNIILKVQASPVEVRAKIEEALKRNADVDFRRISVWATDGTVHLYGNVRSWFERDEGGTGSVGAAGGFSC